MGCIISTEESIHLTGGPNYCQTCKAKETFILVKTKLGRNYKCSKGHMFY